MTAQSFEADSLPTLFAQIRASIGEDAEILDIQTEDGRQRALACPAGTSQKQDCDLVTIQQHLTHHGLPPLLRKRVMERARIAVSQNGVSARHALVAAIGHLLDILPDPARLTEAGPLVLMGTTGVGKSSLGARLGLAARMRDRPVALASFDGAKLGANAQTKAFAGALGARAFQVQNLAALAKVMDKLSPETLLIVDTPGTSPFDEAGLRLIEKIGQQSGAHGVLVQPAGGDPEEAASAARTFMQAGALDLVVTKTDTVRRLGSLVAAAAVPDLRLAGHTEDPAILSGLRPLSPQLLADRLSG